MLQLVAHGPGRLNVLRMAASTAPLSALCKRHVLQAYAANKGGIREKRMCLIDIKAAAAGRLQPADKAGAPRMAKPMSETMLADTVLSYSKPELIDSYNGKIWEPVPNRSGQAQALAKAMAAMSAKTPGKTGVLIGLDDHQGVTLSLNKLRNAKLVEKAQLLKAFVRYDFVARAAKGFKAQCEKQGDLRRWEEKYQTAYYADQLDAQLADRDRKLTQITRSLEHLAADWVHSVKRPSLTLTFAHDFDAEDLSQGAHCAAAIADCIHGAGDQAVERSLLQAWVDGDVKDPDNLIWRALAANNKSLLERLSDAKDLLPPSWDSAKNAWAAADEFEKSLKAEHGALLLRIRSGASDPIANAFPKLLQTLSAALTASVTPLGKAGARAILLAALWSGIRAQPVTQRLTPWQAAMDARQAAWGHTPAARVRTLRKAGVVGWSFELQDVADVVHAKSGVAVSMTRFAVVQVWREQRWVLVDTPTPLSPTRTTQPGVPVGVKQPAAAAPEGIFARNAGLRSGGANAALATGVLIFQALSFAQAQKDLEGEGSSLKGVEITAAYFAALAGMVGAASEIAAASIQLAAHSQHLTLSAGTKGFVRMAGAVGGVLGGCRGWRWQLADTRKLAALRKQEMMTRLPGPGQSLPLPGSLVSLVPLAP